MERGVQTNAYTYHTENERTDPKTTDRKNTRDFNDVPTLTDDVTTPTPTPCVTLLLLLFNSPVCVCVMLPCVVVECGTRAWPADWLQVRNVPESCSVCAHPLAARKHTYTCEYLRTATHCEAAQRANGIR